ncbi:MAG: DUF805 domain-containing protein [Veillonella sp.]|nr:DUF805 domain-containing protein [Veillonella sp.]
MQRCTRCGKEGPDEQPVCLRCGGNMGPLGGPIYTNVHRQTGVTIVDFERYNMGYKDNFINTYLIQWTVISGRSSRGNYWRFMLVIALLWALMYMVCALIGWANADDSDQFIAWVFLVFIMLVFTIIPVVNITIRRLHDVNQSGWLALLMLVPVIGPLVLLNWTVKAGDPEENRFGKPQYTEPVDENLSARLDISTSPTRSTDRMMITVLLVSIALAWYGNYNIAEGVFNVIRGGEFKAAARYSKKIKSEEKSYGLEARISVERFFEEVVNERFRDAHARLGGAEREKYPTKESLAKAYEGVRRVDYDKLEVIADSKDEVQIAFAIIMSGKKDGVPFTERRSGTMILRPNKYTQFQIVEIREK